MRHPAFPAFTAALVLAVACNRAEEPKKPAVAVTDAPGKPVDVTKPADAKPEPTTPSNGAPALPTAPVAVASPDKLIPADATLLAHVDLQGLAGSPLWAANKSLMDADPEVKKQVDALAACNMPLTGFKSLDLGVGADGVDVAAVVTGAGIGKVQNLTCLQDQLKGENFRVEPQGGTHVLVLEGGEAHGYLVNEDTLAFVSKAWDAPVRNLMLGSGTAVRDGKLKDVLAQVDQKRHVWFAGTVSPKLAALTDAIPGGMSGLQSIAGSLDLTTGLALVMSFGMENPDRASATLAQVKQQFDTVKPMAGAFGLPPAAVDRVQFDKKDNAVTLTASLNMDEINAMRAAAEKAGAVPGPASGPNSGPGSKGSAMPTVGGNTAPTGAATPDAPPPGGVPKGAPVKPAAPEPAATR